MLNGKVVLAGIFLVGGAVSLVPLFVRDNNRITVKGAAVPAGKAQAVSGSGASVGMGDNLGLYGGKALSRGELTSDERMKFYEAELQVFNSIDEVLTQRYILNFFEDFKSKNNHPDIGTAQQAFFKDKVVVSPEEVTKFLDQNKDNPGLQRIPEAERGNQIRGYLENQARQGAIKALVDEAKAKGEITVSVPRPVEPRLEVGDGGNAFMGPKDAKVTIVEWADFQCPFCARAVPTLRDVVKKYDGKVRWVFRDFPLKEIHPEALPAAVAANCAGQQGKYFEMHGLLFENYARLGAAANRSMAETLKIDMAKYDACLKDPKMTEEVNADLADGQKVGVNGTPAYFVNGRKIGGAVDVREFSRVIDEELAKM